MIQGFRAAMFRRLLSLVLSATLASQPVLAAEAPYYRHNHGYVAETSDASLPPGAEPNAVAGEGGLGLFAPPSVRARPDVRFFLQTVAANARGPVTWSVVSGVLPDGLSLTQEGAIAGRPTVDRGEAVVVIGGVDVAGTAGRTKPITITVNPLPTVSVKAVPALTGAAYGLVPASSGTFGSRTWSLSGTLPLGYDIDPPTGRISGETQQPGEFRGLVLTVSDADGAAGASAPFAITVTSKFSVTNLRAFYPIRAGAGFAGIFPGVTGNENPVTWSVARGTLPSGMRLDASTGAVTGVPDGIVRSGLIALQAKDTVTGEAVVSPNFVIEMAGAPTLSTKAVNTARVGGGLSFAPSATGLLSGGRWFLENGTLPPGLGFDPGSGRISGGYPDLSVASAAPLQVRVVDLFDGAEASSNPFKVEVLASLGFTRPGLPAATVGTPYRTPAPGAYGLYGAPTWTSYGLPPGLTMDALTGVVSGTPTLAGTAKVGVSLRDAYDGAGFSTGLEPIAMTVYAKGEVGPLGILPLSGSYDAVVGKAFRIAPAIQGVRGSVIWSASALPPWAGFDAGTGAITGLPYLPDETRDIVLSAYDTTTGETVRSVPFSIVARNPVGVAYPAVIPGVQGVAFTASPTLTNAQGPVRYSVSSGALPSGVTLDPGTGVIAGRTFDAGEYRNLIVGVSDAATSGGSLPFSISVASSPWTASPAETLTGLAGVPFGATPVARGFPATPRWSMVSGTLPPQASFNAFDGTITVNSPGVVVIEKVKLQADDGQGHVAQTPFFNIGVYEQRNLAASLPGTQQAWVGQALSLKAGLTNGQGPFRWEVASGALPSWLTLGESNGTLMGTPDAAGASAFALRVTDATGAAALTGTLALTASASPLAFGPVAGMNAPYDAPFSSAGMLVSGNVGPVTYALAEGTLPTGLDVSRASGAVSGTARQVTEATGIVIEATDSTGTSRRSQPFTVSVKRPVLTASGPMGTLSAVSGTPFQAPAPVAKGAVGAVTWSVSGGPGWLEMPNPASGVLSGTPSAPDAHDGIVLTATDAFDGQSVSAPAFGVSVGPAIAPNDVTPRVSLTNSEFVARIGKAFGTGVPRVQGLGPVTGWAVDDSLPPGLSQNAATGEISGTPTGLGSYAIAFTASDASGKRARSATFAIRVVALPTLSVPLVGPRAGAPFQASVVAGGLLGTPSFSLSGNAPDWLSATPSTGALAGRAGGAGTYGGLVLTVRDSDGSTASAPFSVDVRPGIAVTGLSPSYPGRVGKGIAPVRPSVANASGTVSWRAAADRPLPAGLRIDASNGEVTGIPTASGTVALTATDASDGAEATGAFGLALAPVLAIPDALDYVGHEGVDGVTAYPRIVGQRGPSVTFSLAAGTMPSFARFNAATGTFRLSAPPVGETGGLVLGMLDPVDDATATSRPFSIRILPELVVDGVATTYEAQYGKPFTLAAPSLRHAAGAVSWSHQGELPPWAFQKPDGGISSGTKTADALGVSHLSIVGTDATGTSALSPPFTISVVSKPDVSLTSQTVRGRIGAPLFVSASTNGTAIAPVWTYAPEPGAAALPTGLGFRASDASVSGTAQALGTTSFRFRVEDTVGKSSADSQVVSLTVSPALTLAMSDGPDPAYAGRTDRLIATGRVVPGGAVGSVTYALDPPAPAGMTAFAPDGTVLTGIPTAPVPRTTFTATARDGFDGSTASTRFTLSAYEPVRVTGTADVVVRTGVAVDAVAFTPQARNQSAPGGIAWSLAEGSTLPPGITVAPATGRLTGTTTALGTYPNLVLRAEDADGTSGLSIPFAVTVAPTLMANTTTSYGARFGIQSKTDPVAMTNNLGVATYALVTKSGTPPSPAPLVGADGSVTFTPDTNTSPTWTYVIRATDTDGTQADTPVVTVLTSSSPVVAFPSPAVLASGTNNYTLQIHQTGYLPIATKVSNTSGAVNVAWAASPAVPAWIKGLSSTTGAFMVNTGATPVGAYGPYRLTVTDGTGQVGFANLTVTVVAATLAIASPANNAALAWHQGSAYRLQGTATGVTGTTTWTRANPVTGLAGTGPLNLAVSNTGQIGLEQASLLSGTPAVLYLSDPATGQYASRTVTVSVIGPLAATLPTSAGSVMEGYPMASVTPSVTAATAIGAVTWTLAGAPEGVTVASATGVISGSPVAGSAGASDRAYAMTLTGTDGTGGSKDIPFTLTVTPAPRLTLAQGVEFTQDGYPNTACAPVALTNQGYGPAAGISTTLSSTKDFQFCTGVATPCGATLAAGATCNVGLVLNSGTIGAQSVVLTATSAQGPSSTAVLNGNAALQVSQGAYLLNAGTNQTFTLPKAGLNVRILLVGAGASGPTSTSTSGTLYAGSSGTVRLVAIPNAPQQLTYTVGIGGVGTMLTNSPPKPGTATVVTVGGQTYSAAGASATGGGSGGGGTASNYIPGGASNGDSGVGGNAGTGQGASFGAALAGMRVASVSAGAGGGGYGASYCSTGGCNPGVAGGGGGVVVTNVSFVSGQAQINGGSPNNGRGWPGAAGYGGYGYGAGGAGSMTVWNARVGNYSQPPVEGVVGAVVVEWDAQ